MDLFLCINLKCIFLPLMHVLLLAGGDSQPTTSSAASSTSSATTAADVKRKHLPSFWIPSLTPQAKATELKKPVSIDIIVAEFRCGHFVFGWVACNQPDYWIGVSVHLSVHQHFACKRDNSTNISRIMPKLIPCMYLRSVLVKFNDG